MKREDEYQGGQWPDGRRDPRWPETQACPRDDRQRRHRARSPTLTAVAVVAAALGLGVALVFLKSPASSVPAAAPGSTPSASAPDAGGNAPSSGAFGGGGALPPLEGAGGPLKLLLSGKITAKSGTSVTISGNGPSVTATITSSTRFSGDVTSASGIKAGDQVTAQVTGSSPSHMVVAAIEDPGQLP